MNRQRRTASQLRRLGVVLAAVAVVLIGVVGATATAATQTTGATTGAEAAAPNEVASSPIAVGGSHACVLPGDGTVKCWGYPNSYGQLGDGTRFDPTAPTGDTVPPPVTVIAGAGSTAPLSGVTAIAAGYAHTCALLDDGTVKCWGWNSSIEDDPLAVTGSGGQLGDGTRIDRLAPVKVIAAPGSTSPLSGVTAIAAGWFNTCALLVDGTVKCWGDAAFSGGLGDGTAEGSLAPVTVIAAPGSTSPLSGVIAIAAGDFRSCALLADGTVKCWGSNYIGDLSEADAKDAAPVTVATAPGSGSPLSGVIAIDVDGGFTQGAGGYVACALLGDGNVKCWGNNDFGGLGDGTTTSSLTPVDVVGIPKEVTSITAGCALLVDGTVTCWGSSFFGDGVARAPFTVKAAAGSTSALSGVTAIDAADGQTCAVLVDGYVTCWRDSEVPVRVEGLVVAIPDPTPEPTAAAAEPGLMATAKPATTAPPADLGVAPVAPTAPTSFRESVPSPAEITLDPITVAQTLVIATGIVLFVPFPGMLFNSTLEAHYAEIVGRVRAARRRIDALFARLSSWARRRLGRPAAPSATETSTIEPARTTRAEFWRTPRGIAVFVLVTAFLGSFLDPTFGPDATSLAVFAGLAAGLVVILLASNIPRAIAYRWSGVEFFVRALPGTLAVGVACVLISRLTDFQPGYLYGLIVGLGAARSLSGVGEGRTAAVATVVMLVVAAAAWFGLWWLSDLTPAGVEPALAVIALQTAFATIVVAGLEGAAIGLLPMRFLPGETVLRWNRWVWGTLLALALAGFLLILVNPTSGYLADSSRTPMLTIVALLLLFGLGSVLFWAYFRFRRVPATPSAAS